jgi:hypothetical protein
MSASSPSAGSPAPWTVQGIRYRLIEAADTLRRLPLPQRGKPAPLRAAWPDIVQEWTAFGWSPSRLSDAQPGPDAIRRLDETLAWLHLLTRDQRMILWARAQNWTWRKIEALDSAERLGRGRQERQLRNINDDAEQRILAHLNSRPPRLVVKPGQLGPAAASSSQAALAA